METVTNLALTKDFDLDQNPLDPLLHALENSEELRPYVKRVGAEKIAEVVLNLVPFAPNNPNENQAFHNSQYVLADVTPVFASFDFAAFSYVCLDTLTEKLDKTEALNLFESLKNLNFLSRVYHAPQQSKLLTDVVSTQFYDQTAFEDSGRAVISTYVHEILTKYMAFLIHHEFAHTYEDYFKIYLQARELLSEALSVNNLPENERGVYVFLRDRTTKFIHFFQLTTENLLSAEPLTEIRCFHGLTKAGGVYPDTFNSLIEIIQNGFYSQQDISKQVGPNAYLDSEQSAKKLQETSPSTGDSYTLVIRSAKIARTGIDMRSSRSVLKTPEPMIKKPGLNLLFIDEVSPDELSVLIYVDGQTRRLKENLYENLFQKLATKTEYQILNEDTPSRII